MDKSFIDNLHEIVIEQLSDENFGIGNLVTPIDLSTSQTLMKVNMA